MVQISVIIPSYKPGKYVFECLDSIMNQTLDASLYEVILVLNGPRDPYFEKISVHVASATANIRIVYEGKSGVSNARNVGMRHASGEYFAFIDDDDIVSLNYLEDLLKISAPTIIGVSNVHSFVHTVEDYDDNFFACKTIQKHNSANSLFKNRAILSFPVAKLVHRGIIGSRLFDSRFANGEDALFMTQISDKISAFAFTSSETCYFVRRRIGSATCRRLHNRKLLKDTFLLIGAYISIYFSHPLSYNFLLFMSRIPGVIKGSLMIYKNARLAANNV